MCVSVIKIQRILESLAIQSTVTFKHTESVSTNSSSEVSSLGRVCVVMFFGLNSL